MNPRAIAVHILEKVIVKKKSLPSVLLKENPLIQEICYGVLRWYFQLDFLAKQLLKKPLKQKDQDIYILILVGLYQLNYMRIPHHAIVSETVNAARALKKNWAIKLVNGTLRNFLRQNSFLMKMAMQNPVAKYAHPKWLLDKLKHSYPERWETIVQANNQRPPMSLRVNTLLTNPTQYLSKLNMPAHINIHCITLDTPCPVTKLPGFLEGEVSVQDCGAQFAAPLLDLKPQQRVLDACAAPGGKTLHILETEPNISELIAIDRDENRLHSIQENLARFPQTRTIQPTLVCADAADTKAWWDGKPFDRILLDAPCSATGIIRRHPDIKLLKKPTDIKPLAQTQYRLLNALWPLLKPDGKLLYVTCSVLPEENQNVIERFLKNNACTLTYTKQILPGQDNMDGFYYAVLTKMSRRRSAT